MLNSHKLYSRDFVVVDQLSTSNQTLPESYYSVQDRPIASVVERPPREREVVGSNFDRGIHKTSKFDILLLRLVSMYRGKSIDWFNWFLV